MQADSLGRFVEQAFDKLREAGVEKVTGAALGALARKLAAVESIDFARSLKDSKTTFRQLVEATSLVPSGPRGTDFTVERQGETTPKAAGDERARPLRPDIYDAFTKLRVAPLYYDPNRDAFGNSLTGPELPPVDIDLVLAPRREFADTRESSQRDQLRSALQQPLPIRGFTRVLHQINATEDWHRFFSLHNLKMVREWAADKNVPFSDGWFGDVPRAVSANPRKLVAELIEMMSDEDVRRLLIPLQTVEAWSLQRPRKG